jgi:hypothetical protein
MQRERCIHTGQAALRRSNHSSMVEAFFEKLHDKHIN